jgi:hypothetical protein
MSPGKRARGPEVVRRSRTSRLDLTTVLAVVIPLVTVGLLALVRIPPVHDTDQPPSLTKLTNALVVCPSGRPGSPDAAVSTASGSSGDLTVSAAGEAQSVAVTTGAATPVDSPEALVVRGSDDLAPGLVALRSGTAPLSALACTVPSPEQWFTGMGARADHDSVIELVNPDAGPAVADVTLFGSHEFSTRRLRGILIPGHKTITLDLAAVIPRRTLFTAHVVVSRGRLAVDVLDSSTDLRTHRTLREWLPRQLAPALSNELLGLPTGPGDRTLQLANAGDSVARAQIKVVTGDTSFVPDGLDPVSVPPGSTVRVPLTAELGKALRDGALGVSVEADQPITASLLTSLPKDRVLTVPDDDVHAEAATLVPVVTGPGAKKDQVSARLLLSADAAGSAQVTAYDASGEQLLSKTFASQQGHTVTVDLPRGTAFVHVTPQRTPVRGAVLVSGGTAGATVIPLTELLTQGLVPQISPGRS